MSVERVLVVGGGIGGLCSTIALRRAGIEVDLVEKNPAWDVYGVGIIQPVARAYKRRATRLSWSSLYSGLSTGIDTQQMNISPKARAILTDSHFLVPLIVFCIGLALLITLH